jgi:hypothetical protein
MDECGYGSMKSRAISLAPDAPASVSVESMPGASLLVTWQASPLALEWLRTGNRNRVLQVSISWFLEFLRARARPSLSIKRHTVARYIYIYLSSSIALLGVLLFSLSLLETPNHEDEDGNRILLSVKSMRQFQLTL